ncbi:DNA-binding response regulator [Brevibacterium album]|uniref:response regulator transcription factor n=1 Tax=Brevibacterium album TaxID=417948 RepID=UPI0003FE1771|nr:response regulator transcription factor [Brevibacterium album]
MSEHGLSIAIADDSILLREGLRRLLEDEGHRVIAAVEDADQLRHAVGRERPALAIVDVRMPPTHTDEGLRAAIEIKRDHPEMGVLVLSQYVVRDYAVTLLSTHTSGVGYLLKDRVTDIDEFLDSIGRVAAGGTAVDPSVIQQLLAQPQRPSALDALTEREREVLAEMAEGRSNPTIASRLFLSTSSVEKAVGSIFDKLGLDPADGHSRRVRAVLFYLESL